MVAISPMNPSGLLPLRGVNAATPPHGGRVARDAGDGHGKDGESCAHWIGWGENVAGKHRERLYLMVKTCGFLQIFPMQNGKPRMFSIPMGVVNLKILESVNENQHGWGTNNDDQHRGGTSVDKQAKSSSGGHLPVAHSGTPQRSFQIRRLESWSLNF